MHLLSPVVRDYLWGSRTAIPELAGWPVTGQPVAEAWFGAHSTGSSELAGPDTLAPGSPGPDAPAPDSPAARTLRDLVAADPVAALGTDVVTRFGAELPFLLKLIAPEQPLSLQVHPSQQQAALGWVREERAGVPLEAPRRTYKDPNHKPEMVYALTEFEALSGFRTARRALEILRGLDTPLIRKTVDRLHHGSSAQGMRAAFDYVLLGARDRDADVPLVVEQIAERLAAGTSPSDHTDSAVLRIAEHFPGDRGILAALLLNPVTLQPGEALFVPAGAVHAYLSGLGVEVMAASDNVVRAGMTHKHVDARALVDVVDVQPGPPIRIGPESLGTGVRVFYAPVEDFELAVIEARSTPVAVGGSGPRIVLGIEGHTRLVATSGSSPVEEIPLGPGTGVFLAHGEEVDVIGVGTDGGSTDGDRPGAGGSARVALVRIP